MVCDSFFLYNIFFLCLFLGTVRLSERKVLNLPWEVEELVTHS